MYMVTIEGSSLGVVSVGRPISLEIMPVGAESPDGFLEVMGYFGLV